MPFYRTYYHLVWGTKQRAELIVPEIESILYQYIISKAHESEVAVYAINGWYEHIHLVASIPPKLAVATVVKRLKGASSYYINEQSLLTEHFAWQRGYGVFTLGEHQRQRAEEYVRRQKEHHQQRTTNSWLEKVNEFDEGPEDEGLSVPSVAHGERIIKEREATYLLDEFPF